MIEEIITSHTCCFFGHREIDETEALVERLYAVIEDLITNKNIDTFLFGSKSRFNSLCHEQVTKIKEKHPHIKRVYVRAEFPLISEEYNKYLLTYYEDTYYPEKAVGAGTAAYVERNREIIDNSRFCVVYYQKACLSKNRKSGTKIALNYAIKRNKRVILLP